MELVDPLEVLGLGEQHQLGVAAGADQREALQQMSVGEVLAGGHELELVLFALARGSRRRQAGSTFRKVYLTKWRELMGAIIAAAAPAVGLPRRIKCRPCGSRSSRRTRGPTPAASRATSRRSPPSSSEAGHEPRVIAPVRPRRCDLARGCTAAPGRARDPPPEGFVSLGRTVGLPANGAVSNLCDTPFAVQELRRELRRGGYDVVHIHEPVVPVVGWDALLLRRRAAAGGDLPHLLGEHADQRHRRRPARRPAADEPPARPDRGLRSGRLDGPALLRRALPDHPQRRPPAAEVDRRPPRPTRAEPGELRILFIGQAVERKGLPVLLRAFEALREHVPATLTLVGAAPRRSPT